MRLHYWTNGFGNFGDDLNPWLWQQLIPELSDLGGDDVVFSGVGTVLNEHLPAGRINVVLGSGVGYGPVPKRPWKIYALRGPLTARALRVPTEPSYGDPAILVPRVFEPQGRHADHIVFAPHWTTMALGGWAEPCRRAGCMLLDPRGGYLKAIDTIASAKLVIAESMHAAIIADAFRVLWLPVVCTHANAFKWFDWLAPLDMTYRPRLIDQGVRKWVLSDRAFRAKLTIDRYGIPREPVAVRSGFPRRLKKVVNVHKKRMLGAVLSHDNVLQAPIVARRANDLMSVIRNVRPELSSSDILRKRQDHLLERIDGLRSDWADLPPSSRSISFSEN